MKQVSSMRIDKDLFEWVRQYLDDYNARSIPDLFNSILYVAKYGRNSELSRTDAIQFMLDASAGELATKNPRLIELQTISKESKKQFFEFMDNCEYSALLNMYIVNRTKALKTIHSKEFIDKISSLYLEACDIPLMPWECKELLEAWIVEAETTGKLLDIRRKQLRNL